MDEEKTIKPIYILLQLLLLFAILLGVSYFYPKDGISIAGTKLEFATVNEIFGIDDDTSTIEKTLVIPTIDSLTEKTAIVIIDTAAIRRKRDSINYINHNFQYSKKGKESLYKFFGKLDNSREQQVRIIHFGDSQIEGDRMSGLIRNELQKRFGGYGPGLFTVKPIANSLAVNLKISSNWNRSIGFIKVDTSISDKYGVLFAYSNFDEAVNIKQNGELAEDYSASIRIRKHNKSYHRTRKYDVMRLFYNLEEGSQVLDIVCSSKDMSFKNSDSLELKRNNVLSSATVSIESRKTDFIDLYFKGESRPDILGISLESNKGVVLDNVALRGSSGTMFKRTNKEALSDMFSLLDPKLIILQFGGNVIPYIKEEKKLKGYTRGIARQIRYLKQLNPNAAIVFIGPGDMSTKKKTKYISYPVLPSLISSLKNEVIKNGCVYWDMYEVMGGNNSMVDWVNNDPKMAAEDHIHFTPTGAKWISKKFINSLFLAYDKYRNNIENKSIAKNSKTNKKGAITPNTEEI
ncbi:MAG: hypothetical protein KAH10_09155 [Flavobacteriales bacterium]|nr:hypothetical protein [Flavobacteriales bacterium]